MIALFALSVYIVGIPTTAFVLGRFFSRHFCGDETIVVALIWPLFAITRLIGVLFVLLFTTIEKIYYWGASHA